MSNGNARVMLASEYPEARQLLVDMVKEETGGVVVGEAGNSIKAMTLARNLRPDLVVMDSRLPYIEGLDAVSLSRVSGLDTALAISEEARNIQVILLNNLDVDILTGQGLGSTRRVCLSRQTAGATVPLTLQEASDLALQMSTVIFANVGVKEQKSLRQRIIGVSDTANLLGIFAILGGLALIATMFLAQAGAILASVGGATLFLSMAVRLSVSLWPRAFPSWLKQRAGKSSEDQGQ